MTSILPSTEALAVLEVIITVRGIEMISSDSWTNTWSAYTLLYCVLIIISTIQLAPFQYSAVVVVVIAQPYRQLSRLRKSATVDGLSQRSCIVSCVGWLWQLKDVLRTVLPLHTPDRHQICRWWCGPCNCSKADSDQNATGWEWYGLTKAADFQVVRYRVVKLQGLCSVENSVIVSDTTSLCLYPHFLMRSRMIPSIKYGSSLTSAYLFPVQYSV